MVSSKTPSTMWWPTIRKDVKQLLPDKQGAYDIYKAPQPFRPAPEQWAPQMSGFENQQGLCPGEQRVVGNRAPTLEELVHRLTCHRTKHKSSSMESTWTYMKEIHLPILKHLPEEEELIQTLSRIEVLVGVIFAFSLYLSSAGGHILALCHSCSPTTASRIYSLHGECSLNTWLW